MRFRLFDLLLLVIFSGLTFGLVASSTAADGKTALVCFFGVIALPFLFLVRPRIGTVACPYCGRWAVRPLADGSSIVCGECGSRFERTGPKVLQILSSPSDERVWARKFLPKLSRIRTELRPDRK